MRFTKKSTFYQIPCKKTKKSIQALCAQFSCHRPSFSEPSQLKNLRGTTEVNLLSTAGHPRLSKVWKPRFVLTEKDHFEIFISWKPFSWSNGQFSLNLGTLYLHSLTHQFFCYIGGLKWHHQLEPCHNYFSRYICGNHHRQDKRWRICWQLGSGCAGPLWKWGRLLSDFNGWQRPW